MSNPPRAIPRFLLASAFLGAACNRGTKVSPAPLVGEARCESDALAPPLVDPSIAVAADGGSVLARGSAVGTQNYICERTADGGGQWILSGPQASLRGCDGATVADHFASDAGADQPEWRSPDGAFVVARKVAAFTPQGSSGSVPWVLLKAVGHGGAGALSRVVYVQRVATRGGVAPVGPCALDARSSVPYTADYYFYGP